MNDLLELLAARDTQGHTLLLHALRDGLVPEAPAFAHGTVRLLDPVGQVEGGEIGAAS